MCDKFVANLRQKSEKKACSGKKILFSPVFPSLPPIQPIFGLKNKKNGK